MSSTFLLSRDGLVVSATVPVLAPEELGALADAEALLAQAQQQAAAIVAQAHASAEQQTEEARAAGAHRAQQALAARLAEVDLSAARAVTLARAAIERICVRATADLVHGIEPAHWFHQVLRRVESGLREESFVELRVAPDEAEAAAQACARLAAEAGAPYAIRILPDAALPARSAQLRTSSGVIEATLEMQLDALRTAIGQAVARVPVAAVASTP